MAHDDVMTDDELIDLGLQTLIREHEIRAARNPFGSWADDSREITSEARSLVQRRAALS